MDNLDAVRQILANETTVWQQSSVISMKLRRFVTTFESLCAYGYKKRERMKEALSARLGLTSVQLSVLEGELFQRGHPTCACHDVGDYQRRIVAALLRSSGAENQIQHSGYLRIAQSAFKSIHTLRSLAQQVSRYEAKLNKERKAAEAAWQAAALKNQAKSSLETLYASYHVSADNFPIELYLDLQSSPHSSNYWTTFGVRPTATALIRQNSLSRESAKALRGKLKELKRSEVLEKIAKRRRTAGLLSTQEVPLFLGISTREFVRWRDDGRIPVSEWEEFRKWGSDLKTSMHHPDDLAHITPAQISHWRESDVLNAKRRSSKSDVPVHLSQFVLSTKAILRCEILDVKGNPVASEQETATALKRSQLQFGKQVTVSATLQGVSDSLQTISLRVFHRVTQTKPADIHDIERQLTVLANSFSDEAIATLNAQFQARILEIVAEYRKLCPNDTTDFLFKELQERFNRVLPAEYLRELRLFLQLARPALGFARTEHRRHQRNPAAPLNDA